MTDENVRIPRCRNCGGVIQDGMCRRTVTVSIKHLTNAGWIVTADLQSDRYEHLDCDTIDR